MRRHDEQRWTAAGVRDQRGRTALVTGANTGVGFQVAKALAERGATVMLACRDQAKAANAIDHIRAGAPDASVTALALDLASLASVRDAAARVRSAHSRLDLLINNAGVMFGPHRRTADGFESQFGTNHLGHFALSGHLLGLLRETPGARVVTVTSPAHKQGHLNFADLQSEKRYRPTAAYAQSKLANLLFAYQLNRRLSAANAATVSSAAHPGAARTELNRNMSVLFRGPSWGIWRPFTHTAEQGAMSILRAAIDPGAQGGEYYGPDGMGEFKGRPARLESSVRSHDVDAQRRLWEESERLTGVTYDLVAVSA